MPGVVAMPLPVVGELDGRVPVLFDALLPDGPQGLLVPDWPLAPELPGVADGEPLIDPEGPLPPPAAPPVWANAKPGVAAIKAAVRIARVGLWVIIRSLRDEPLGRNAKRIMMFLRNSKSSPRVARNRGSITSGARYLPARDLPLPPLLPPSLGELPVTP
jgi:hypothetical protein